MPEIDYALTRKLVIRKPTVAITSLMGRVNQLAFRIGRDTYPPETLRFDGASVRRAIPNRGVKCYEITYKFGICSVFDKFRKAPGANQTAEGYLGWNRFFNFDRARYEFVYARSGNQDRKVYLFDQDAPGQTMGRRAVTGFGLLFNPYAS